MSSKPTEREGDRVMAADAAALRVEESHWPLAIMLVFTQVALGVSLAAWIHLQPLLWVVALAVASAGVVVSVLHLGQPLKAWRVFLGLRRSWLSREIVVFGAWVPSMALAAAASRFASWMPHPVLPALVETGAILLGALGVFCSMMVYIDTRRPLWSAPRTAFRFGSTVILGFVVASAAVDVSWIPAAGLLVAAKLAVELGVLVCWSRRDPSTPEARSAGITYRLLHGTVLLRWGGVIAAVALLFVAPAPAGLCLLAAETAERLLFFRASPVPRMPGL